ncbi:MAG: DUF58 domain-containing protein [Opitutales bacterium]|nr:DUF58 domain-containing protein [Opitutales bacterium]
MPTRPPLVDLLSPATLHKVGSLAMIARIAVNGFLSGLHRSISQGQGGEFLQYRNYYPGDDLKYVDWKVFAKREKFYTKVYREETNMDLLIVADASGSMDYQGTTAPCGKWRYASMLAACLAYLATKQGDNVGLYVYQDEFTEIIPPNRRGGNLERVLASLQRQKPGGPANHRAAWQSITNRLKNRGIIVFLSDFLEGENILPPLLNRLPNTRHDCAAFHILDRDEIEFPFSQSTEFISLEENSRLRTYPEYVQEDYQKGMNEFLKTLSEGFRSSQTEYRLLKTDETLAHFLAAYLRRRERLH